MILKSLCKINTVLDSGW